MPNIPGLSGYIQPSAVSRVRTIRRSVSIPGGLRILAIMGLGRAEETVVLSATGGAADGLNADFSGANAPDGRHFQLSKTSLIAQRTELSKNSIPLFGIEQTISTSPFNSIYDYRMEPATGRIELQRAHIEDQGGQQAPANANNIGSGSITTIELIDVNAPSETWTIRATSVIRDAYGDPIPEATVFTAVGSVSGQPTDAYGAPITFVSDGTARDNGTIRVALTEGSTPFERNDRFSVKISSGVLKQGDLFEAKYIATEDLNDPQMFVDANALYAKHGFPSEANTLSLGAEIAFENGAFAVMALQAKPSISRRTSEVLLARDNPLSEAEEGFPAVGTPLISTDVDSFKYTLDGGVPDSDTVVNLFVIDGSTGVETQIFPTKVAFYNATLSDDPFNNFVDNANYSYSYTVILEGEVEDEGNDGEVVFGESTFTAASASFSNNNLDVGEVDTQKQIRILSRDKFGNDTSDVAGTYDISSVGDSSGDDTFVTVQILTGGGSWGLSVTDLKWELVDAADESARVMFTKDLYIGGTISVKDGLRSSYIDNGDVDFFDTNWGSAFEQLESVECQIVVPLPDATYSAIQQAAVAHCELMSNTANQRERVTLIGAQRGVTSEALIGRELVAVEDIGVIEGIQGDDAEEVLANNIEDLQNFKVSTNWGTTFRAMYFWPDEIVRPINGTRTLLHGFYMAAAAGGLFASEPNLATPLTRKVLTGFDILRAKIRRPIILNELGAVGVAVVQPVTGGGRVLHGKTTTSGGEPTEEEVSVIFTRDRVASSLRAVLRGFIGQAEDPTLIASITAKVQKTLQAFVSQGLLSSFRSLSVARDEVDPRQWNVVVEVAPIMPVNWIFIDISVGIF